MALQFRRGTSSERLQAEFIPESGEPIYETDTKKLFIGDGTSIGGVPAIQGFSVTDCSDINLVSDFTFAISSYSVSSGLVTVTFDAAHPFIQSGEIHIVSSSVPELIGIYNVSSITNFTVNFINTDLGDTPDTPIAAFASITLDDGEILVYSRSLRAFINGRPVTSLSSLTDVTLSSVENGQILIYDSITNKWENGPVATTLDGLTDVEIQSPSPGQTLTYDPDTGTWVNSPASGLSTRQSFEITTNNLASGSSETFDLTAFKTYVLISIEVSAAAWVAVYSSTLARTNDLTRSQFTDPLPGSGVIAEIITDGPGTQFLTPGVVGFNSESPVNENVYIKVVNTSNNEAEITVTLTMLRMEA